MSAHATRIYVAETINQASRLSASPGDAIPTSPVYNKYSRRVQSCLAVCQGSVRRLQGEYYRGYVSLYLDDSHVLIASVTPAAFLTQTVSLDDGTTVKFEIW